MDWTRFKCTVICRQTVVAGQCFKDARTVLSTSTADDLTTKTDLET